MSRVTAGLRAGVRATRAALVVGGLLVAAAAQADEAGRWELLFAAVPPPPAQAADALARIGRRGGAPDRLALVVTDPMLMRLQRDVDALRAPESGESAAAFAVRMRAVESDPELARLAAAIDRTLGLGRSRPTPPSPAELRALQQDVERTLAPRAADPAAPPTSPLVAYRSERAQAEPRAALHYRRLFAQQADYAARHAALDRAAGAPRAGGDAARAAAELVAAHRALAQRQLADARDLFTDARAALRPFVERMAALVREAAARDAPATELGIGWAFLQSHVELLLTIDRVALEDAGFWQSVQPARDGAPAVRYASALAPEVDLGAGAALPLPGAPYPPGRAAHAGPPGIR
jgi:hypothetical protein